MVYYRTFGGGILINIRNGELEALRMDKLSHFQMVKDLEQSLDINYISTNYESFVSEPISDNIFEAGKTYIINHKNNKIGMLGTKEIDNKGRIELWYIINKYYRGKGYGNKFLGLITQYLIEYVDGVNDVELLIDEQNNKSIKCALNNGYSLVGDVDKKFIYRYFN